jgi:hypothetical protein
MASLLKLVTPANVLFSTDFPPGGTSCDVAKALAELGLGLTHADLRAIDRDNACACCRGWQQASAYRPNLI